MKNYRQKEITKIQEISMLMSDVLFPQVTGLDSVFCIFKWSKEENEGYACGIQIFDKEDGEVLGFSIITSENLEKFELGILEEIEKNKKEEEKPDNYYDKHLDALHTIASILNRTIH